MNINTDATLALNEIFYSIQGESTYSGRPCIFIRLAGCPLRCSWCDTSYAFTEGKKHSIQDILEAIKKYPCKLVELTGGEPLAQKNCSELAKALQEEGYELMIETSGSFPINVLPRPMKVVMDIKAPGSGESSKNLWSNIGDLKESDEVKFVCKDKADFDYAMRIDDQYSLSQNFTVLISPVFGECKLEDLSNWILESAKPLRLQTQLHKEIWDPNKRGV